MAEFLSNQDFLPPKEKPLSITVGFATIPKIPGEPNGDAVLINKNFFGVFDGTSDSYDDHKASSYAKNEINDFLSDPKKSPHSLADAKDLVNEALNETHLKLFNYGEKNNSKLSTTASVGFIFQPRDSQPRLIVGNCGDSRVYLFDGKLGQITLDDNSVRIQNRKNPQEAFKIQSALSNIEKKSDLSDELKIYYRYRNMVFNCLGAKDSDEDKNRAEIIEPRIIDFKIEPGDLFLFGSDGLFDNLTNREIEEFFKQDLAPQAIADSLIFKAKQRSLDEHHDRAKLDDISAIVVKVDYQP